MFHSCTHKDTRNRGNSRGFTCDWCRLCYFVPRNWRVNARSGGKTTEPARLAIEVRANLFANWSFNYFFSRPAYGSVFSSLCLAFYFFIPSFFTFFFFFSFYFSFYRPRFLSFVRNRRPFRLIYFGFYAVIDTASTSFFLGSPVFLPFIRSREPIFPRWILKSIPLSPCAHSSREIS